MTCFCLKLIILTRNVIYFFKNNKVEEVDEIAKKEEIKERNKRVKRLKKLNHFIERIVKRDRLNLVTNTQSMINHVVERLASVVSRVSPVKKLFLF